MDPQNKQDPIQPQFMQQIESEADSTLHPLLEKILNNLKLIGLIIGGIVLIAAGISGYKLYQNHRAEQATARLGEILSVEAPGARAEKLAEFAQNAPSNLAAGIELELARSLMQNKDYKQAAKTFADLKNMDEDLLPIAVLGQAKALQLAGDYGRALKVLEEHKGKLPKEYKRPLKNMLAFCAEKSQNWQKALAAYQELKSESSMAQGQGRTGFFDFKIKQMQEKTAG